jgi:hypothetical protein
MQCGDIYKIYETDQHGEAMNTFSPPLPVAPGKNKPVKVNSLSDIKPAVERRKGVPMLRTSQGLRDVLFEEIELIRSGSKDYQRAASVAGLAKQIVATADLDLKYRNAVGEDAKPVTPMQLGSK